MGKPRRFARQPAIYRRTPLVQDHDDCEVARDWLPGITRAFGSGPSSTDYVDLLAMQYQIFKLIQQSGKNKREGFEFVKRVIEFGRIRKNRRRLFHL